MVAVVVVAVVFSAGVSYAQEDGPPQVPDNVQKILKNLVGKWSVKSTVDDMILTATMVAKWGPGKQYVIANESFDTPHGKGGNHMLTGWDGLSDDGIVMYRIGIGGSHGIMRGKIVSDTLIEGENETVTRGEKYTDQARFVKLSPDKFVYTSTKTIEGKTVVTWKSEYTRIKKK